LGKLSFQKNIAILEEMLILFLNHIKNQSISFKVGINQEVNLGITK